MRKKSKHRQVQRVLSAAVLTAIGTSGTAQAVQVKWAFLPTASGGAIYQWEVASYVRRFFVDGSLGSSTVQTPVVAYFTQCFGGDWIASFNSLPGQARLGGDYDTVLFANGSAYSANLPGLVSVYGGYHEGISGALAPFAVSGEVHEAGVAHRYVSADFVEIPVAEGPSKSVTGGHTFVLNYAGLPEDADRADVASIHARFFGRPNTDVTNLVGDGSDIFFNNAATRANLRSTLERIGAALDPGNTSTFVFFTTDHGGLDTVELDPAPVAPASSSSLDLVFGAGQAMGAFANMGHLGTLTIATLSPLPPAVLGQLQVLLNDHDLDIAGATIGSIELPGVDAPATTYTIPFPVSLFNIQLQGDLPPDQQVFPQALSIVNNSLTELQFEWIALGPGNVPKLSLVAVPEPAMWLLLAFGAAGCAGSHVRRNRAGVR